MLHAQQYRGDIGERVRVSRERQLMETGEKAALLPALGDIFKDQLFNLPNLFVFMLHPLFDTGFSV